MIQSIRSLSPYRVISITLYLGVIISKFIKSFAGTCERAPITPNDPLFFGSLIFLIGLELFEHKKYPDKPTFWPAVGLLATRMILIEVVRTGDCTYFYGFLYLLPPLIAFRYFTPWTSYLLGIIYFFNYAFRMYQDWGFDESVDEMLIYTIGLIFGFMMINTAVRASPSLRTELTSTWNVSPTAGTRGAWT